jgi:muramidase (phage lysozyme)
MHPNLKAFLDMIAESEGTTRIPGSDNGYKAVVGDSTFADYAHHPNIKVWLPGINKFSTAAGRYQILFRYWKVYKRQLQLPDFGPASQDAVAVQLIKECHALQDIERGHFRAAVKKCASRWASLPGAGYGQHEHKIEFLEKCYARAGGIDNA